MMQLRIMEVIANLMMLFGDSSLTEYALPLYHCACLKKFSLLVVIVIRVIACNQLLCDSMKHKCF